VIGIRLERGGRLQPALALAVLLGPLLCVACGRAGTVTGPGAEVRDLTGARARIVWVQQDGSDPEAVGDQLVLMGFDTHDGLGERVILGTRGSYVKPLLTSRGDRIVYSTRLEPGPPEVFVVDWDGSNRRKIADGFALGLWKNPNDGSDWAYVGAEHRGAEFGSISRMPIDAPDRREAVWNTTLTSIDSFQVSPDGRYAGGLFPWPEAGIADLQTKTLKKLGNGCWPSLTHSRGVLFWYFDGAHRNLTMVDVEANRRWVVNINNAPGFDGAEVNSPRWTNHPRFFTISGPYNQGGPNQVRSGGPQAEIYLGRFSEDFSRVEGWARVTKNGGGDVYPDVWLDLEQSPHPRVASGRIGPAHAEAPAPGQASSQGKLVVNARLLRTTSIPDPKSILPYRHALAVNEYEVMDVVQGNYAEKEIRIAQWAIRDSRELPAARKFPGVAFTLAVDRFDQHPELEGERLLSSSESSPLPLYYEARNSQ
jgi:hypothetical protein